MLDRHYKKKYLIQPQWNNQRHLFLEMLREAFCPIHRLLQVEQLHNTVYLCRLYFFHDSFNYLHLVSFPFNLKHISDTDLLGHSHYILGLKATGLIYKCMNNIAIWIQPILIDLTFLFLRKGRQYKKKTHVWDYFFFLL